MLCLSVSPRANHKIAEAEICYVAFILFVRMMDVNTLSKETLSTDYDLSGICWPQS